ncbi:MAG: redox-regulated ATPase YchF [Thermoanaerobaculia bacterium]|nr:redox-regulated ATPase YchF [Thermoanaerobaculia bacterium]
MQLGIVGLPKVGKTLLFNILTRADEETGKFAVSRQTHVGVARVEDSRLAQLRDLYQPKRYTPATVDYVDLPGVTRGDQGPGPDLAELRNVDALMHVVRCFEDPEIPHSAGSVDPVRDLVDLNLELVLADHDLVSRRLERLAQASKRGLDDEETRERDLLTDRILPALEAETPLRELELEPEAAKRLRGFQLLSAKPQLVALNVEEGEVASPPGAQVLEVVGRETEVIVDSAPIEAEISRLDDDDQRELLSELGLEEPSTVRLIRAGYHLLGLISYFTVGEDEVRAWTIHRGTAAREAARKIHSDIARGFIRAEVVAWDDLIEAGSWPACRERALLHLEGKEYEVRDGDVINFRFNV